MIVKLANENTTVIFVFFSAGDLSELRDSVKLDEERIAAFSDDCSTMSKRFSLMDVSTPSIHM